MAESGCGVMSNSVNTQNQHSAVQRNGQTEESDKTDQVITVDIPVKRTATCCSPPNTQVMVLMLLQESTYRETPQSVRNVLQALKSTYPTPCKNDIIASLLYVLMLETGFVPKDCTDLVEDSDFNHRRLLRLSSSLPEAWKTPTCYHMDFFLKSAPETGCTITGVSTADDLLVNCRVGNSAYSLLVDPLMYFTRADVTWDRLNFQNLDRLGINFKNSIAFPAKVTIVNLNGGICGCLQHLPYELIVKIMSYLTPETALNLARTCRDMCEAALDASLWIKLLSSDFRKRNMVKTYAQLKSLYEIKYATELQKMLDR